MTKVSFDTQNPVRLLFGSGQLPQVGLESRVFGKRAMIVTTGPLFRESGLLARVERSLSDAGLTSVWYSAVSPNPLDTEIDRGADVVVQEKVDLMIGLGGGSAMDAAKGIAAAAGHAKPIWHYADPANRVDLGSRMLPMIAVPTTAGTGSEVTQYIVVTHHESHQKPGIGSMKTFARVAIVDPDLTESMPPAVAAASGVDVLAHSIEAYASLRSTPLTDLWCEEAFRLVGAHLVRAVDGQASCEDREGMALGATLAGLAIAHCRTTVCHALGHAAGGIAGLVHGEVLAALTPAAFRYSMTSRPEKYGRIAGLLAGRGRAETDGGDAEAAARAVEALIASAGMSRSLTDLGVRREQFDDIVAGTLGYMKGPLEADPADVTREGLLGVLEAAL